MLNSLIENVLNRGLPRSPRAQRLCTELAGRTLALEIRGVGVLLIESTGAGVKILGRLDEAPGDGGADIVAARQGHLLGTAFHPEVTDDLRFHSYFLNMARERRKGGMLESRLTSV